MVARPHNTPSTMTDLPSRTRVGAFLEMLDATENKISLDFMPGLYGAGLRAVAPWTEGLCHDISKCIRAANQAAGIVTKYVFVGATPGVSISARVLSGGRGCRYDVPGPERRHGD